MIAFKLEITRHFENFFLKIFILKFLTIFLKSENGLINIFNYLYQEKIISGPEKMYQPRAGSSQQVFLFFFLIFILSIHLTSTDL